MSANQANNGRRRRKPNRRPANQQTAHKGAQSSKRANAARPKNKSAGSRNGTAPKKAASAKRKRVAPNKGPNGNRNGAAARKRTNARRNGNGRRTGGRFNVLVEGGVPVATMSSVFGQGLTTDTSTVLRAAEARSQAERDKLEHLIWLEQHPLAARIARALRGR